MLIDQYFDRIEQVLKRIRETQYEIILRGAVLMAASLRQRGAILVMDTGHLLRFEAFKRAGGLLAVAPFHFELQVENPIEQRKVERSKQEREALLAREVGLAIDASKMRRGDILLVNSNSGHSARVVETALQCGERGIVTFGIASRAQMTRCAAEHPSGKKLAEAVDLFIDNCGVHGDALVPVAGNEAIGPSSGIAAAYILWALEAHTVDLLENDGIHPSIYRSVHAGGEAFMEEQRRAFVERGI